MKYDIQIILLIVSALVFGCLMGYFVGRSSGYQAGIRDQIIEMKDEIPVSRQPGKVVE